MKHSCDYVTRVEKSVRIVLMINRPTQIGGGDISSHGSVTLLFDCDNRFCFITIF